MSCVILHNFTTAVHIPRLFLENVEYNCVLRRITCLLIQVGLNGHELIRSRNVVKRCIIHFFLCNFVNFPPCSYNFGQGSTAAVAPARFL